MYLTYSNICQNCVNESIPENHIRDPKLSVAKSVGFFEVWRQFNIVFLLIIWFICHTSYHLSPKNQ